MQEEPSTGIAETFDITSELARPRLIAILFCDWVNQTADNKANLIGTFDRILMARRASVTPQFTLFVRLAQVPEGSIHVRVYDPSGKLGLDAMVEHEQTAEPVTEGTPVYIQIIAPMQFEASQAGVYWFDVSYGGKSLGAAPLIVQKLEIDNPQRERVNDPRTTTTGK